jgi:hypothetical protein
MWDGLPKPTFHGFMVDVMSTNYHASCKVYGGETQIFFWKPRNVVAFTIGRKTYEYKPKIDTYCF